MFSYFLGYNGASTFTTLFPSSFFKKFKWIIKLTHIYFTFFIVILNNRVFFKKKKVGKIPLPSPPSPFPSLVKYNHFKGHSWICIVSWTASLTTAFSLPAKIHRPQPPATHSQALLLSLVQQWSQFEISGPSWFWSPSSFSAQRRLKFLTMNITKPTPISWNFHLALQIHHLNRELLIHPHPQFLLVMEPLPYLWLVILLLIVAPITFLGHLLVLIGSHMGGTLILMSPLDGFAMEESLLII